MSRFSRVLHHIDMNDVKRRHQEKIVAAKLEEERIREEKEYIASVVEKEKSDWKKEMAKYSKRAGKTMDAVPLKRTAKKSLAKKVAKKVVGKLGIAGKAAVGASMLYHYSKKTGCKPGMSKVTKNGKSYCTPSKGSKKGRDY